MGYKTISRSQTKEKGTSDNHPKSFFFDGAIWDCPHALLNAILEGVKPIIQNNYLIQQGLFAAKPLCHLLCRACRRYGISAFIHAVVEKNGHITDTKPRGQDNPTSRYNLQYGHFCTKGIFTHYKLSIKSTTAKKTRAFLPISHQSFFCKTSLPLQSNAISYYIQAY